jgi:hypothetical protein
VAAAPVRSQEARERKGHSHPFEDTDLEKTELRLYFQRGPPSKPPNSKATAAAAAPPPHPPARNMSPTRP